MLSYICLSFYVFLWFFLHSTSPSHARLSARGLTLLTSPPLFNKKIDLFFCLFSDMFTFYLLTLCLRLNYDKMLVLVSFGLIWAITLRIFCPKKTQQTSTSFAVDKREPERQDKKVHHTHPGLPPGVADHPVLHSILHPPASHRHDVVDERLLVVLRIKSAGVGVQLLRGHDPTAAGQRHHWSPTASTHFFHNSLKGSRLHRTHTMIWTA